MAKYKKRADGRYSTSITLVLDGEKKKKIVYGKTIREVDDKISELRAQSNNGIVIDDRAMTMEIWARKWLEVYKRGKVSANTFAGYENAVNAHIIPAFGNVRLQSLRKHHLQELLNKLVNSNNIPTAKKVKITLGQLIRLAVEEQYMYSDISQNLTLPTVIQKQKRVLTDDEIHTIQSAELEPKERAFIDTLLYTGARRGEILALTSKDIDFEQKKIHINKTLVFGKNQCTVKHCTKTAAGMRTLPLPDRLATSLSAMLSNDIIFPSAQGEYMTRTAFRRFWEKLRMHLTLPNDVTPHTFRHTYATKLFFGGVDVKTAQYLLGHSSIQVTLDIYTHLSEPEPDKILNMVDKLF